MDRHSQILKRIEAFIAVLNGTNFDLKDVKVFVAGQPVVKEASMEYHTTLTLKRIKENFIDPEANLFWQLPSTIEFYEAFSFSMKKHYMRYQSY